MWSLLSVAVRYERRMESRVTVVSIFFVFSLYSGMNFTPPFPTTSSLRVDSLIDLQFACWTTGPELDRVCFCSSYLLRGWQSPGMKPLAPPRRSHLLLFFQSLTIVRQTAIDSTKFKEHSKMGYQQTNILKAGSQHLQSQKFWYFLISFFSSTQRRGYDLVGFLSGSVINETMPKRIIVKMQDGLFLETVGTISIDI